VSVNEAVSDFPAAPQSAGAARRFVQDRLDEWKVRVHEDEVVLMVSELVTNVGLHARTVARVRIIADGTTLRVEVRDDSPEPVQRREHSAGAETGRGLMIVDALAATWGTERHGDGKTVWFEVPAGDAGDAQRAGHDELAPSSD
jgi:anti-sigma regulatory factor (Ser/Thr protein kinase)